MHHVLYMYMSFIFAHFFCFCALFFCQYYVHYVFFVMGSQLRWASAFTGSLPLLQLMYMLCISTWQINSLSLERNHVSISATWRSGLAVGGPISSGSSGGYTISVSFQPIRSTQPFILPELLCRVPALAGVRVRAGISPLPGGIVQQICVKCQKNCGFGAKNTKIGTDHAEYTWIDFSYSAKPDF